MQPSHLVARRCVSGVPGWCVNAWYGKIASDPVVVGARFRDTRSRIPSQDATGDVARRSIGRESMARERRATAVQPRLPAVVGNHGVIW